MEESLITHNVTFSVDMSKQIANNTFNPDTDLVAVLGSFDYWGYYGESHYNFLTIKNDSIYSATLAIPVLQIGYTIFYKFWVNNNLKWENGADRTFITDDTNDPQVLDTVFFNG
jgi:hypothetical protein